MVSIENQIAVVTGAGRGIGQAIAIELGKLGARVDSEALAGLTVTVPGAKLMFDCATLNSPAAKPTGLGVGVGLGLSVGVGLGLGVGEGDGLTEGLGVGEGLVTGTPIKLAPVKSETPPSDSVVIAGDN